jgi:ribonuclease R
MTNNNKKPRSSAPARSAKRVLRHSDPHLERESERYENPLPSREFVLETLAGEGVPVAYAQLTKLLGIKAEETEAFARRLAAMERAGQIVANRHGDLLVAERADLIPGRVEGHPDGFGFLIPDGGGADLYLGPREMKKVLHRDRALVREIGVDRRGRPEASIVEVLERANHKVVGRLLNEHGVFVVAAENKRISQDILIPPDSVGRAHAGQVVVAELVAQPDTHAQPVGRIVEILGNYADPGMEIEIALRKHDLPYEFSAQAVRQADRIPEDVHAADLRGRTDLRELPLVTIDGETARDFDDAVYCEPAADSFFGKKTGFRLVVAIADVSHYVRPNDALDVEARERGTSVYFPRRVIPMLPERLSNGICSLNPDVDRLVMVCDMKISAKGEIKSYRFYPGVMLSRARLTYTWVAAALKGEVPAKNPQLKELLPHLQNLENVFRALLGAREKRGALDFESDETQMHFNASGKIERITPVVRNDAHRLIEECMLAANVCTAELLLKNEHHGLYRVHEGPTPERLEALRAFLKEFGLSLGGGDTPNPAHFAELIAKTRDRPDARLIHTVMLRSLKQAVYTPDNKGHFGLAYEAYAHFTSPIRRYPDLVTHRAINAVLAHSTYNPGDWGELGAHCSQTERRADEATRDVENWLKCYYMKDHVGAEFGGTVAAVTGFGLFVALDELMIEGLVHISELGTDYFHYDQVKHCLLGERTGKSFRLGDRVTVKVARVDLETTKIDLVLAGAGTIPRGGASRPARGAEKKPARDSEARTARGPGKTAKRSTRAPRGKR